MINKKGFILQDSIIFFIIVCVIVLIISSLASLNKSAVSNIDYDREEELLNNAYQIGEESEE